MNYDEAVVMLDQGHRMHCDDDDDSVTIRKAQGSEVGTYVRCCPSLDGAGEVAIPWRVSPIQRASTKWRAVD